LEGTSSTVKLKAWSQRKYVGLEMAVMSTPLIDKVHRLMHLWQAGDVIKVDEYLDMHALGYNTLFGQLLQALIELAPAGSEERERMWTWGWGPCGRPSLMCNVLGASGLPVHFILMRNG